MISENVKETARFLGHAFETQKIERNFSFLVIYDRNRPDHTKSEDGVLDNTFRIPITALSNLSELQEHGFIETFEEHTSSNSRRWKVQLKKELLDFVANEGDETNGILFQPRIFISYSSQDDRIEVQLEEELRKNYSNVWSDKNFVGGEKVWSEILDQIAECDIFIYLLSPDSIKSFACRVEFSEAMRWGKPIIPVLLRPAQIPSYIQSKFNLIKTDREDAHQINKRLITAISNLMPKLNSQEILYPLWEKPSNLHISSGRLSVTISVPANIEPTIKQKEKLNTGIILLPSDTIAISATGQITNDILNGQARTWITPDGIDQHSRCSKDHHAYWKQYCIGSLIGWISEIEEYDLNLAFFVGKQYMKALTLSDSEGFLYFAINDNIGEYAYRDNDGEFTVSIKVTRN